MQICELSEGKNIVRKGEFVFIEGSEAEKFGIILQGKFNVLMSKERNTQDNSYYKVAEIGASSFMGINGVCEKQYIYTYEAAQDSIIYIYPAGNVRNVKGLLNTRKEYSSYIIASSFELFKEIYNILTKVKNKEKEVITFKEKLILYYFYLKENLKLENEIKTDYLEDKKNWYLKVSYSQNIKDFENISHDFFKQDISEIYKSLSEDGELVTRMEYFKHIADFSDEEAKKILTFDDVVTNYNIRELSSVLMDLKEEILEYAESIKKEFEYIFNNTDENIFCEFIELCKAAAKSKKENNKILEALEYIMQISEELKISNTEHILKQMELLYSKVKNNSNDDEIKQQETQKVDLSMVRLNAQGIPVELENSLSKILSYSEIENSISDKFKQDIDKFLNTEDKHSTDAELRNVKKSIEEVFFDVYERVFKKVVKEGNNEKIYNMFLNYSYMDERLLNKKEILDLYCISDKFEDNEAVNIYNARRWLEAIYNGEREPSLNDLDMDYYDTFRELKKTNRFTDKDKDKYDRNQDAKVTFEIVNFIKRNQRLCCGQSSAYFPILCSESIVGSIDKGYISASKITESFRNLKKIDFSLFYRESFCHDPERGLEKYYYQKEVVPDIILLPTFGLKSVMWQPIAMRDKNKPARFAFPAFTCENLDNLVIRSSGAFRWEMCKTIMGVSWSDITQKSLTSEYADYIQFYRKNNELSNEAKEKVKELMAKSRNMLKEAFASDYETWIKYESTGAIRLNKVARNIMYIYCPFSKEYRSKLEGQVAFAEAANIYNRNRTKKLKELELRASKLEKTKFKVPKEILDDIAFYRDL